MGAFRSNLRQITHTKRLRERLAWRDAHAGEVIRAEREARRRIDQEMVHARDGFLLSGGDAKDWPKVEKQIRDEVVRGAAKTEAEAAHASAFRHMKSNF